MIHWRIQGGGQSGHVRFVSGSLQYIICYYTCRITKSVVTRCVFKLVRNALVVGARRRTTLEDLQRILRPIAGPRGSEGGEVTREKDRERVRDGECGEGKGMDVSAS